MWPSEATQRFCNELAKWHAEWETVMVSHLSSAGSEGLAAPTTLTVLVQVRCEACGITYSSQALLPAEFNNRAIFNSWVHQCAGKENPQEINFDGRIQRWSLSGP